MEKKVLCALDWTLNIPTPHALWHELRQLDIPLPDLKNFLVTIVDELCKKPASSIIPPSAYISKTILDSGISLLALPYSQKWSKHLLNQN